MHSIDNSGLGLEIPDAELSKVHLATQLHLLRVLPAVSSER
jgi:hypothetical protein